MMFFLSKSVIYGSIYYSTWIVRIKPYRSVLKSLQECSYCNATAAKSRKEEESQQKEGNDKAQPSEQRQRSNSSSSSTLDSSSSKFDSSSSSTFGSSSSSSASSSATLPASSSSSPGDKDNRSSDGQKEKDDDNESSSSSSSSGNDLPILKDPFLQAKEKNKNVYLQMVDVFVERNVHRRNHVEFIYAALKHMKLYGVERDLEVYKALINVMPKGKFIPTNIFQAEFMHYPKQQQCIIDLLEQMEDLGVMPDPEMESMLLNVFGRSGHPLRKYWRMMYWMPKFKNLSPWPLPNLMPNDGQELAKMAVERMCSVDLRSKVSVYDTKTLDEAIDHTWIVSGISPEQSQLLHDHSIEKPLYIEGPFTIWLRNCTLNYFTLRADPDLELLKKLNSIVTSVDKDDVTKFRIPFFNIQSDRVVQNMICKPRSVHQQDDGTILSICATGTSSKDSLLSWIRLLEKHGNPILGQIPILFRFRSKVGEKEKELGTQSALTTTTKTTTTTATSTTTKEGENHLKS